MHFHTFKQEVLVTRCSNNYGPYQFPEKLIPLMIMNALADKPLPVYGDGLNVRDWIHVEDHCAAIVSRCSKGKPGEVYNVGSDGEMRNIDVVKMILARPRSKPEIRSSNTSPIVSATTGATRLIRQQDAEANSAMGTEAPPRRRESSETDRRGTSANRAWWDAAEEKADA